MMRVGLQAAGAHVPTAPRSLEPASARQPSRPLDGFVRGSRLRRSNIMTSWDGSDAFFVPLGGITLNSYANAQALRSGLSWMEEPKNGIYGDQGI
jgi:hypothetical protein